MLRLLQVNEVGHIPYGKKRAFILTNETRLLAFIWIMQGDMTDLRTESKCPENNRHSARWWILEVDLEHDAQNSYPLAPEKKVIKSEMSGYQKRLMTDLNLEPPNSKTLVLTLRVTLRDASQKKTKPLSGVLGGRSCLAPARTFSRRWQGGCLSHLTSGNEVWGPEGSLSTPSHLLGRGWTIRVRGLSP